MNEITEREIVEAAKALNPETDWLGRPMWNLLHASRKWELMERAYAALRAARKVRK